MKNTSVRLEARDQKELRRVAKSTRLSPSDLIRQCVVNYLPVLEAKLSTTKKVA